MRGKRLAAALLTGILCFAAATPAAAAAWRVDAVYLALVTEEELYGLSPGEVLEVGQPVEASEDYDIDSYSISYLNSGAIACTMDVWASSGGYFDNQTMVSVYGAYEVSVLLRTAGHMRVTARMYPVQILDEARPQLQQKKATWNAVDGASSYSVIVYYFTEKNDNTRRIKKTSKSTEIDLSSYEYIEDVAVRPETGSGARSDYIALPYYINTSGMVDEESSSDDYIFHLPTATYGSLPDGSSGHNPFSPDDSFVYSSGGTSANTLPGTPTGTPTGTPLGGSPLGGSSGSGAAGGYAAPAAGWFGGGDVWYYLVNQTPFTGWLAITQEEWYYMQPGTGLMKTGWFNDGAYVYRLNTNHDGSFGKMLTGYQVVDGQTYYFNETHNGAYGAMYHDCYTPNGRWADQNGIVR